MGRYIVFLKNTFPRDLSMEGMKISLWIPPRRDLPGGAADAFTELGADVEVIHLTPDG